MISINDILPLAATAIRGDSATSTFLAAQYPTQPLKIFIGEDTVNPPLDSDAPFVVVWASPRAYDRGTQSEQFKPTFEVDFALLDTRVTADTSNSTFTQTGQTNIITFSDLIAAALLKQFNSDGDHFQSANANFFGVPPLWEGGLSVTLTYERGMGDETL